MSRQVDYQIGDPHFVMREIQRLYGHPHKGFKEYISNAMDNRIPDTKLTLEIRVNKNFGSLTVQDNGTGMTIEELERIPASIGLSSKRGLGTTIGEKAFGMLAYPSVGAKTCTVYSRKLGSTDKTYNFLQMVKGETKATVDQVSRDDIPYEAFTHGTLVVLAGIDDKAKIDRYFKPSHIQKLISETFSPLIRDGTISVNVGYVSGGQRTRQKLVTVSPAEYKGILVIDDSIEVTHTRDGQERTGTINVYLYVNPKGTNEKVRHFNKGVNVLESVTSLDELSKLPWGSGKLGGEINEDFLTLVPARDAPVREGRRYSLFTDALLGLEGFLNDEIDRLKIEAEKSELDQFASKFLRMIDVIYREFREQYDVLLTTQKGGETAIVRPVPPKILTNPETQSDKGRKSKQSGGGDSSIVDKVEDGEESPVNRARRTLSRVYTPVFTSFDLDKRHLRSELDEVYDLIRINTDHPDYKAAISDKDSNRQSRYNAMLLSKEVALGQFNRMVREGLDPMENAHRMTEMWAAMYWKGIKFMGID